MESHGYAQKKRFAILTMVVLIFVGIIVGGNLSIGKEARELQEYYSRGTDGDGEAIAVYLSRQSTLSQELLEIAARYFSDDAAEVSEVRVDRTALESAENLRQQAAANRELSQSVAALGGVLQLRSDLVQEDAARIATLLEEFEQLQEKITQNPYNEKARAFNAELQTLPAAWIARLISVQPAELFE